ncbi:MAG TPA: DUF2804 family protein [Thermoleophilaceae bacterium]|jgi:hypothetical protein
MRKRWRWVGVFSPELMLCAGDAWVGPLRRRWWSVVLPDGTHAHGWRGVRSRPGRAVVHGIVDIRLEENDGFELTSTTAAGNSIWTRKQGGVPARGRVTLPGSPPRDVDARAIVDDSAGRHDRHTFWRWSAGVGSAGDGTPVAWNLVDGIHDAPGASERRVWRDGESVEVGPVEFAPDLSRVAGLAFTPWAERRENVNLLVLRSRYRQPFGSFSGELPDGTRLREGYGVMEEHDALW